LGVVKTDRLTTHARLMRRDQVNSSRRVATSVSSTGDATAGRQAAYTDRQAGRPVANLTDFSDGEVLRRRRPAARLDDVESVRPTVDRIGSDPLDSATARAIHPIACHVAS